MAHGIFTLFSTESVAEFNPTLNLSMQIVASLGISSVQTDLALIGATSIHQPDISRRYRRIFCLPRSTRTSMLSCTDLGTLRRKS